MSTVYIIEKHLDFISYSSIALMVLGIIFKTLLKKQKLATITGILALALTGFYLSFRYIFGEKVLEINENLFYKIHIFAYCTMFVNLVIFDYDSKKRKNVNIILLIIMLATYIIYTSF